MKCQQGRPKRSSRGTLYEETWPETDRNYWHPCTKNWAGQCRGRLGSGPRWPFTCRIRGILHAYAVTRLMFEPPLTWDAFFPHPCT